MNVEDWGVEVEGWDELLAGCFSEKKRKVKYWYLLTFHGACANRMYCTNG